MLKNIFCTLFGHKASRHILGYSIDVYGTYYEVSIYDIAKCSRCGEIYHNKLIDKYQHHTWYIPSNINTEDKKLRLQDIVPVIEAYALLGAQKTE